MAPNPIMTFWSDHGDSVVTVLSATGEAFVCGLMIRKQLWRRFPMFLAFVTWAFASDVIAMYLKSVLSDHAFFKFYIAETVVDSVLMFAVLVELGWSVLRPAKVSLPRGTVFVLAALIAVAGLLIWPLAGKTLPAGYTGLSARLFHLQQTFAILRTVCFLVMAGFSQLLVIGWRDRELQVATGLGFYSIVSLMVALTHLQQGVNFDSYHYLDQAAAVSYLCTVTYWVFSFAAKEQERKEFSPQMQNLLLQLGGGARTGRIALTDLPSERLRKKE